jgi:hypothetical protein
MATTKGELILKRFNLLLFFLCFSLLLSGCSGGSDNANKTRTLTVNLPRTYSNSANQSFALPAGKSCVIIAAGFDQSKTLVFQEYTFTHTALSFKITIPNNSDVAYLAFVTDISLDQPFTDLTTWSYLPRTNMITATALQDVGDGTKTNFLDSSITTVRFSELVTLKNKSTFTTDIKEIIKAYCAQLNIKLAEQL